MKSNHKLILLIILTATLLYGTSFRNFFFGDDFYHLAMLKSQSIIEGFNLFAKPTIGYFGYRPIPNQIYWRLGETFFGLDPLGYHVINYLFFVSAIILTYFLVNKITGDKKISLITTAFYAFSSTHFYRLYFLSNIEETMMTTFVLLTILYYLKSSWLTIPFFVLSLMCKEIAIMTPILLFVYHLVFHKKFSKIFWVMMFASGVYLLAHKFLYGFLTGNNYDISLNPFKLLNNYSWYFLWATGFPESFVNTKLFAWPTIINTQIFQVYGQTGKVIAVSVIGFLSMVTILFLNWWRNDRNLKLFFLASSIFVLYLVPVSFFQFHKFPYSMALPAIGFSMVIALLSKKVHPVFQWSVLLIFLLISLLTAQFNLENHWSVKRATIAENVLNYLNNNYSRVTNADNIYFREDDKPICRQAVNYYASMEVEYALSGQDGPQVYFDNQRLSVYYEGLDNLKHLKENSFIINSAKFL